MTIIIVIKPESIYNRKTHKYRQFGTAADATLIPIWLVAFIVAVATYSVVSLSYTNIAMMIPFLGKPTSGVSSNVDTPSKQSSVLPATKSSSESSTRTILPPYPASQLYEYRNPETSEFQSPYMMYEDEPMTEQQYDEIPPWSLREEPASYYNLSHQNQNMQMYPNAFGGGRRPRISKSREKTGTPYTDSTHRHRPRYVSGGVVRQSRVWRGDT